MRLLAIILPFCFIVLPAMAQPAEIVLFDDDASVTSGVATGDDFLELASGRLPLETGHAFSGAASARLAYRHGAGSWEALISSEADVRGFDSLIVYVNGPAAIVGSELPRLALAGENGARSGYVWMSPLENIRITGDTGFTPESPTDAVLDVSYVNAMPANERRPGYPENVVITFSDEPLDTSVAGIGVPAKPARFRVESASGRRLAFRFRDTDDDGTLSNTGEYIDILLPESAESDRLRAAWRIQPSSAPAAPPGAGDVFRLAVAFDEFELDADPSTWQRLSFPLDDFAMELSRFTGVVFAEGGTNPEVRTLWIDRVSIIRNDDDAFLEMVQRLTFDYFWKEANPQNGLIRDRSRPNSASSIAAVGFGLSAITVGIERGYITYEQGRARILTTLRFFWNAPQSTAPDATGYKGFFYHFLNMETGRRAGTTELSTIDTALLMGGVLHVREYFVEDDEIRLLADSLYHRVDWKWASVRAPWISHGWRPESGFIGNDYRGYNEAMILYLLALGSPTHPVEPSAWSAWTSTYSWETHYGYSFIRFPPLFGHQYSHTWFDFRGIQDAYMRGRGIDYFENSRRATLAQRAYHIANPLGWPNYSKDEWGLTASDTPDGYRARGAPPAQNDDGTLVPTAPGGSIAFAPRESIAALRHMHKSYPRLWGPYGFRDAYNVKRDWFDNDYLGIDQGPIILMIENLRTEQIWTEFMRNEHVQRGLEKAGFRTVTSAESIDLPASLALEAVYPNPTTGPVTVAYSLAVSGHTRLVLYDVLGREVAVVVDGVQQAGSHLFAVDAGSLPVGVYFVSLTSGGRREVGRMVRVR